jgi:hypothetical protein
VATPTDGGGWLGRVRGIFGRKANALHGGVGGGGTPTLARKAPVKIDPKVFFANERTFLAWMHVSVILAGASVAIVAFTDSRHSSSPAGQLYGVVLLPVSISFIIYAMMQCEFVAATDGGDSSSPRRCRS